jgi:hypothetical protein
MASRAVDWRATCLLLGTLLWFGLTNLADAHIPSHEEWDDVLSASKNEVNGDCCGLGEAHLVEFDDWRLTRTGEYEVYIRGRWRSVAHWKLTTNVMNPTGKAIVWYEIQPRWEGDTNSNDVKIHCFRPLQTY